MFAVTATISEKLVARTDGKKIQSSEKSDLLAFLKAQSGTVYEMLSAPTKGKAMLFLIPSQDCYILVERTDEKDLSRTEEGELNAFIQVRIAIQKWKVDELQLTNYRFRCCSRVTNVRISA